MQSGKELDLFADFEGNKLRFISFGSGSSGNCYLLFTASDAILIDAGIGERKLRTEFSKYGLSLDSVNGILITHDHADHVKAVGSLSSDYKLPVYTTAKIHGGILVNKLVKQKIEAQYVRNIEKNVPVQIGAFKITPFDVPHDSTENVGYMIEAGGIVFSIVTDCGHVTDEIRSVVARSNYLVIEANHDLDMLDNGPYPAFLKGRIKGPNGHLSNADCGETLAQSATSALRHVWLCHLSAKNNKPETARETVESLLRANGIEAGKDFLLDVLERKTPTGIFDLE